MFEYLAVIFVFMHILFPYHFHAPVVANFYNCRRFFHFFGMMQIYYIVHTFYNFRAYFSKRFWAGLPTDICGSRNQGFSEFIDQLLTKFLFYNPNGEGFIRSNQVIRHLKRFVVNYGGWFI